MTVQTEYIEVTTKGHTDIIDITPQVNHALQKSGLIDGVLTVFVPGSTAGVTSIEYEYGLLEDLPKAFERMAPTNIKYIHDTHWGDNNGYAHVRAALLGASFTVPFTEKRMLLGTWQQIVLVDFDNRSRHRKLVVQLIGE